MQQSAQKETIPVEVRPDYKPVSGLTMKALAWFGKEDVRLVDAPMPDITQDEDVIVRVTGTTICGSDLHLYHGEIPELQPGDILGHEFMGVVDKVGSKVQKLKVGQRVVASFQIACGHCEFCKQKLSSFCDNTNNSVLMSSLYGQRDAGFFGYSHLTGGFPGGQAEFVRVPKGEVNLLPLPDEVRDEQALYLSDILPTSFHAVADTGVKEGDVVGVWGLGPIGQLTCQWAGLHGAKRIIAIDGVPERLEFALHRTKVDDVIDFREHKDVVKRILELVPHGLDVAIDCGTFHEPKTFTHKVQKTLGLETDVPETINEMIVATRKMGRVGLIAVYAGFANGVNVGALMEKGVRLIGNGQAPVQKYWSDILYNWILPGKLDARSIVTHRVPLDDMPKLYAAFDKRQGGVLKAFVETKYSSEPSPGYPRTSRVDEWADV
jgi:threonine dehydrogenase-like Zn-dependent dehydrogenase